MATNTFAPPCAYRIATPPLMMRASIQRLEATMREMPDRLQDEDLPLKHTFAPGAYAREIFIPKGALVVGKIHRHAHLNILVEGRVALATEEGMREIEGPLTMVSAAGTKRALLALEDAIWITIHLTDKTDLAEIEDEIIAKDYAELDLIDRPMSVLSVVEAMEGKIS